MLGAIEYFEWIGKEFGNEHLEGLEEENYAGRRLDLKKAMIAMRAYEYELSRALLSALKAVPGITVVGLMDVRRLEDRLATYFFHLKDLNPRKAAEQLARQGIYMWDGNRYAIHVTERLGLEGTGGTRVLGGAKVKTYISIN